MLGSAETHFIRPDYEPLPQAATVETQAGGYWTDERRRTAEIYQYYVYRLAARIVSARPRGSRAVADVGCGYPYKAAKIIGPHADSVAGFDQPTLSHVIERDFPLIDFRPIDLEAPPQIGDRFDVVICSDVVEHLLAPDVCLRFLRSITKPDGILVLSTPERDILRGLDCLRSPKPEHVREWTRAEFAAFVGHYGLQIVDHRLMPELRLSGIDALAAPFAAGRVRHRKWSGCQTVVCRPA